MTVGILIFGLSSFLIGYWIGNNSGAAEMAEAISEIILENAKAQEKDKE